MVCVRDVGLTTCAVAFFMYFTKRFMLMEGPAYFHTSRANLHIPDPPLLIPNLCLDMSTSTARPAYPSL
jgi:hypothetical protein